MAMRRTVKYRVVQMRQYMLGFALEEINFGRTGRLRCAPRSQRNRWVGRSVGGQISVFVSKEPEWLRTNYSDEQCRTLWCATASDKLRPGASCTRTPRLSVPQRGRTHESLCGKTCRRPAINRFPGLRTALFGTSTF